MKRPKNHYNIHFRCESQLLRELHCFKLTPEYSYCDAVDFDCATLRVESAEVE